MKLYRSYRRARKIKWNKLFKLYRDRSEAGWFIRKSFEKGMFRDYPLTIRHKGQLTDVLYNASIL
jgi:hypothetical protein